jgi:hypothetical protein
VLATARLDVTIELRSTTQTIANPRTAEIRDLTAFLLLVIG